MADEWRRDPNLHYSIVNHEKYKLILLDFGLTQALLGRRKLMIKEEITKDERNKAIIDALEKITFSEDIFQEKGINNVLNDNLKSSSEKLEEIFENLRCAVTKGLMWGDIYVLDCGHLFSTIEGGSTCYLCRSDKRLKSNQDQNITDVLRIIFEWGWYQKKIGMKFI